MDYTLSVYDTDVFEGFVHSLASTRLVKRFGYPPSVAQLEFLPDRAIVGLVIDKCNGNLLKINRFSKVKIAFHGLESIDFREHRRLYRDRVIDLRDPNFKCLDTAFAISHGVLFAQIVQLKKEGQPIPDFSRIDADVNLCIDSLHSDGTIKDFLRDNLDKYVVRDPKTASMLELLKAYGKKLLIITNSDYGYTRDLLDFSLNPYWKKHKSWREVFDLVITLSDKPSFFEKQNRFLRVDPESGAMTNHIGPVSSGIWQGGWFGDVQDGLCVEGNEILYLGDHIYGDVVSIRKSCDWRTGLVLNGMEKEIEINRSTKGLQVEIDRLMTRKTLLEKEVNEAEMTRRLGRKAHISEKLMEEQNRINNKISRLLDEFRTHYNPWWGEILRAGSEESRYAYQVINFACIYMTRVSALGEYSPHTYFRPRRRLLAHEVISSTDSP